MKKLAVTFCLCFVGLVYSQLITLSGNFKGQKVLEDQWWQSTLQTKISEVEGSPYYLNGKFSSAKVANNSQPTMMRYNSFHDNIEFLDKDNNVLILLKEQRFNPIKFTDTNEELKLIGDSYYFIVYEGNQLKIYKKIQTKFQKLEKTTNGYQTDKPAKFFNLPDAYFIYKQNQMLDFPKTQKKVAEMFPDKKDGIAKLFKESKLKLNNDKDIKQLSQFLDN